MADVRSHKSRRWLALRSQSLSLVRGGHGTVGALGRSASFHATPGDLLSHLDIGVLRAAEARYKRFLLDGDLLWIRISDSRALPLPALSAVSADVRLGEFVWSAKLGYRVVDHKKVKADVHLGARYWHLGQKLNLQRWKARDFLRFTLGKHRRLVTDAMHEGKKEFLKGLDEGQHTRPSGISGA